MVVPLAVTDLALPAVKSLADCADYTKTFANFLPQLYDLSNRLTISLLDIETLKQLYITTNPAISGLAITLATIPVWFLLAEITRNFSQVDRAWSIIPTVWNIHYAVWARLHGLPTQRLDNVMALSVLWSIRLTFNFWRKGGYQAGSEDYRWEINRQKMGAVGFFLLDVLFISSVQPILLWSVTLPTYILLLTSRIQPEMGATDNIFRGIWLALVVIEWFADQQQWDYHQAKKTYRETAKVPKGWTRAQMERGFNTTGLWKYSRHPNFAAEQSIWILLYQYSCFESNTFWNWTVGAVIAYVLVFQGSTPLTEWISGSKYPEYRLYQERVGRFVPALFGGGWNEKEMEKLGEQVKRSPAKKR